jgi:hypothetical protein
MRFYLRGPRILGVRPGVSFGPNDFRKKPSPRRKAPAASKQMTGGFVYVLRDESGRHKIGLSTDPIDARIQLQSGSAERLSFAYVGVAPDETYIEIGRAACDLLEQQKITTGGSEWFRVSSSIAIGSVIEAAGRVGAPIQQVSEEIVSQIIFRASQPEAAPRARLGLFARIILGLFGALVMTIFLLILIVIFFPPPH